MIRPISSLVDLFRFGTKAAITVNMVTMFRIFAFPILIWLLVENQISAFKWLLLASLLTDLVDGTLARWYHVQSVFGARLDSVGDDLTVFAGIAGIFYYRFEYMEKHIIEISLLFVLYVFQVVVALVKFGRLTAFHTILAKWAAFCQGMFICSAFFFKNTSDLLFYNALLFTSLDLAEEIALVFHLKKWRANIKGYFWLHRRQGSAH